MSIRKFIDGTPFTTSGIGDDGPRSINKDNIATIKTSVIRHGIAEIVSCSIFIAYQ
jgi:hypothetical protein